MFLNLLDILYVVSVLLFGSPAYVFPYSQFRKCETSLQIVLYNSEFSVSRFFHVGCVRVIRKGLPNYKREKCLICGKSVCLSTLAVRLLACLICNHMASSWPEHVTRIQLLCFMHTAKAMGKLSSLKSVFPNLLHRVEFSLKS